MESLGFFDDSDGGSGGKVISHRHVLAFSNLYYLLNMDHFIH